MEIGDFEIDIVSDGVFKLDGGTMFGIIPKTIWEKYIPADEKNRVTLGLNSLLIRGNNRTVLIDTGFGPKISEKDQQIYELNRDSNLLDSLANKGVRPEDVDTVIFTHLHLDHAGWNTKFNEDGEIVTTFPNAQYIVQKGEWEDAVNPNEITRGSYIPDNLLPLERNGQLRLIEGDFKIFRGLRTIVTGGHTQHHQAILIESRGKKVLFIGDLVPTTAHIKPTHIMSYDHFPLTTLEIKKRLLQDALKRRWLIVWCHDRSIPFSYLSLDERGRIVPEKETRKGGEKGTRRK